LVQRFSDDVGAADDQGVLHVTAADAQQRAKSGGGAHPQAMETTLAPAPFRIKRSGRRRWRRALEHALAADHRQHHAHADPSGAIKMFGRA
jgi:hypothetical protein